MDNRKTIFWCNDCKTPIIGDKFNKTCTLCGAKTKYLCTDIRPVFPEERPELNILSYCHALIRYGKLRIAS